MEEVIRRAIAAGLRAAAEVLEGEGEGGEEPGAVPLPPPPEPRTPTPGSAASMRTLLRRIADLNDTENRGATQAEAGAFAREAGMDSRGTAGYYYAGLLEVRRDGSGRWITAHGRDRLRGLEAP